MILSAQLGLRFATATILKWSGERNCSSVTGTVSRFLAGTVVLSRLLRWQQTEARGCRVDEVIENLKQAEKLLTDMLENCRDSSGIQKTLDAIRATITNLEARDRGNA